MNKANQHVAVTEQLNIFTLALNCTLSEKPSTI